MSMGHEFAPALAESTDASERLLDSQNSSPERDCPEEVHPERAYSQGRLKIPKRGRGPSSTIICNHIGWVEVMALIISPLHPGFTPSIHHKNTPLLGTACRGLQSLFIDRGSDQASRDNIVQQIADR